MLESLAVSNFALIEDIKIEFSAGFNVFTGETGAGKSIVLDAVGAILGARSSADYIRKDCDAYCIQAIFDIKGLEQVALWLQEHAIAVEADELILLRRLTRAGKNTITANGMQIPLAALKELGSILVDIHAQHHNQMLLQQANHLALLDAYADDSLKIAKVKYKEAFEEYKVAVRELEEMQAKSKQREQMMDILDWQIKEIQEVNPKENEYEELQDESKRLSNLDKIKMALESAHHLIENDKGGLMTALHKLENNLSIIGKYEPKFQEVLENVKDWQYILSDSKLELADYYERLDQSPMSLEQVQDRLDAIYRLYKKHGDYPGLMEFWQKAQAEYQALDALEDSLKGLEEHVKQQQSRLEQCAAELTRERSAVAVKLAAQIQLHIRDLAMPEAVFQIEVTDRTDFGTEGRDEVVFMFSGNRGQDPKPVHKIASGGEISRIFLALKTVLMSRFNFATMIFDEVDTGVGGTTAQRMAEKLVVIAQSAQTICVTHLPQVACMADRHMKINKYSIEDRTITDVQILNRNERIEELAGMMAGESRTNITKESAAQMLDMAVMKKAQLLL